MEYCLLDTLITAHSLFPAVIAGMEDKRPDIVSWAARRISNDVRKHEKTSPIDVVYRARKAIIGRKFNEHFFA